MGINRTNAAICRNIKAESGSVMFLSKHYEDQDQSNSEKKGYRRRASETSFLPTGAMLMTSE